MMGDQSDPPNNDLVGVRHKKLASCGDGGEWVRTVQGGY
jgi:hypothetical protein